MLMPFWHDANASQLCRRFSLTYHWLCLRSVFCGVLPSRGPNLRLVLRTALSNSEAHESRGEGTSADCRAMRMCILTMILTRGGGACGGEPVGSDTL